MPFMNSKPKKGSAWLPNQVEYGMDVSDPDPANWKAFGRQVDEQEKAKAAAAAAAKPKVGLPPQ